LGLVYPASQFFQPYQIATHFFMHASFFHILFNMFGLVMLGSHLERIWGPKRYLLYYFGTAIGAAFLYTFVQGVEIYQATGQFFPKIDIHGLISYGDKVGLDYDPLSGVRLQGTEWNYYIPCVGASGAIYGLIMAFAILFPNTEFMLIFPPIPIKAKWMALILAAIALYSGFRNNPTDSVAHFAHLGGMLFGFIMIKLWQKNRSDFY
jgi:membrane associated rhomboid family serine protease